MASRLNNKGVRLEKSCARGILFFEVSTTTNSYKNDYGTGPWELIMAHQNSLSHDDDQTLIRNGLGNMV